MQQRSRDFFPEGLERNVRYFPLSDGGVLLWAFQAVQFQFGDAVDVPGRRALRSARTNRLVVPPSDGLPSAAELFRSPLPTPGTLFLSTSSQLLRCSHLSVV